MRCAAFSLFKVATIKHSLFSCMAFVSPVPVLQSALFRQPPTHGSLGPGRKHFLPLLHHTAECSVYAHLREGAQRIHRRYTRPSSRPALWPEWAWLIMCSSPHHPVPLYGSFLLMSDHVDASLPLVWFDHGRFHLAFDGESGYSAVHLPSFHLAVLPHACWSPSQNGVAEPIPLHVANLGVSGWMAHC